MGGYRVRRPGLHAAGRKAERRAIAPAAGSRQSEQGIPDASARHQFKRAQLLKQEVNPCCASSALYSPACFSWLPPQLGTGTQDKAFKSIGYIATPIGIMSGITSGIIGSIIAFTGIVAIQKCVRLRDWLRPW